MVQAMPVITRFAPSPSGILHIGGARTALFNWLYARHRGGIFRLRIEDTDRARSTEAAIEAILEGLKWLGLDWDDEVISQSANAARHAEVAAALLEDGKAYRCYCTPAELDEMRRTAKAEGRSVGYDGRCRNRDPSAAHPDAPPAVRFKAPREGVTLIDDLVQGEVRIANAELDDMVIARADGSPTYMLSVVVDDHDMGVTHVVRGDDHLNNAARQSHLFAAMAWAAPAYAHIPLIHGADGAKLSKRHGATGLGAYRDMGILPEAMRNYLLRLGWSHGDDEEISTEQAIAWFDIDGIGKSPARFDLAKLESLSGHYLRATDPASLVADIEARLVAERGRGLGEAERERLVALLPELRKRPKTLLELYDNTSFILDGEPRSLETKAAKLLDHDACSILGRLGAQLAVVEPWSESELETRVRGFAEAEGLKLGAVAQPLRAALTGRTASPGIFEVLEALGREESQSRIARAAG
jgi:glutamyl-tRNA synthetase